MKIACYFPRYDWSLLFPFKQIIGCARKLFSFQCVWRRHSNAISILLYLVVGVFIYSNIMVYLCIQPYYWIYKVPLIVYLSYSLLFHTKLPVFSHALVSLTGRDLSSTTYCGQDLYMVGFFLVLFHCLRNQYSWIAISSILFAVVKSSIEYMCWSK